MNVTATQLRQDLFRLLDQVLETGEPLEIQRNGRKLRVVPDQPERKFDRLISRPDFVFGDLDDLVELKVSEWEPDRTLNP